MTPLQRAAQAIFDAEDPHTGDPIGHTIHMSDEHAYQDGTTEQQLANVMATCRLAARAVIEAIRQPSEAMLGRGGLITSNETISMMDWHAMIDALLSE